MNDIVIVEQPTAITTADQMAAVATVADHYAAASVFADHAQRKAKNTLKAQRFDLVSFAKYLDAAGVTVDAMALQASPVAWQGVSFGIVEGFVKWLLGQGHAVASINRKLSTVKKYATLAAKAKVISTSDLALIKTVNGYSGKEVARIDETRPSTRKRRKNHEGASTGYKKAAATPLTDEQAQALKAQPDTPQGRRDAVLMALLLDHGLRAGEVAALQVSNVNLKTGMLENFVRPKVDKVQNHKMSADTLKAMAAWFASGDAPALGPVLRGSRKGGALTDAGMSTTSISERVRTLGKENGIDNLSAHDCRHYWATRWAGKVDLFRLQEAGGWNSLSMPRRYTERAKVANEGMA